MIHIGLLGGLRVEEEGRVLETFPRRKAAALLALLALRPRQRHAREEVAAQLWPDADTATGRRNLRQTLLYLRQAVAPWDLVHTDVRTLWLREEISTDIAAFEEALHRGATERARSLWRGELLPGFFEEAILAERERLNLLFATLARELPTVALPARTLPIYLTEFYGRDEELEWLSTRLAEPGTCLVTLLGAGGIGKTRLAVTLAGGAKREAAFVELAALAPTCREEEILERIAAALALSVTGTERHDGLLRLLASRPLLLILDNAEHVLAQTAAVVLRLLPAAPRLKVLVTSREPLRLAGERTLTLEPLSPAIAARLLQTSARAVRPNLPEDPEALRAICAHLEGLPIALELAASQCRSLSLRELAEDLRLGAVLQEPASTSLPLRHRSLEATLAWSEALLSPVQQRLLRRLAVFPEGGGREAILEICQASRADLAALVEKSLVQAQIRPEGATRYRFLEPIRQWARERLIASGEHALLQESHARWYLALAERAAPELRRADQAAWLKRLDAEQANLAAAGAVLRGDEGLRLVAALTDYTLRRGQLREGIARAEYALAHAPEAAPHRAAAQLARGLFLLAEGQPERARAPLEEAARSDDRRIALEAALHQGGGTALVKELGEDPAWRWHRAQALLLEEQCLNRNDDHERRIALASQAAALFEAEGDLTKVMEALFSLVGLYLVQQRFATAAPLLTRLQETAALLESTHLEVLALHMQLRSQRAQTRPDPVALTALAERLSVLAPRLAVPMEAYNAWHDLLQVCRHRHCWHQGYHALGQMLHFRQNTIHAPLPGVYLLGAVASFLADIGETGPGGQLYGYLLATREAVGVAPNALEQRVYARDLTCLGLGRDQALAAGAGLTFEDALALAQAPVTLPADGTPPPLPPI